MDQLRCTDRQLARVVDRVAAVRWNARMESSSLRSCASHLRMIAWECRVFGIDPCRPDMLGIRRIAACVNNFHTLAGCLLGKLPWKLWDCQVTMIRSFGDFVVALVACNCHVCRDSEFDEDCSADCWYVRFRSTLLVGHGGPSSASTHAQ